MTESSDYDDWPPPGVSLDPPGDDVWEEKPQPSDAVMGGQAQSELRKSLPRKLPIIRDEKAEAYSGIAVESAIASYNGQTLQVIGEFAVIGEPLQDEYRVVQVIVYDSDGDIVGRKCTNWGDFGVRQSFALTLDQQAFLGSPAKVRIFPSIR